MRLSGTINDSVQLGSCRPHERLLRHQKHSGIASECYYIVGAPCCAQKLSHLLSLVGLCFERFACSQSLLWFLLYLSLFPTMFLDPAPKRGKDSMYASRILPANRSTEALGDQRQKLRRKPPLRERSPTRSKYQLPSNTAHQAVSAAGRESLSPTVRLVSHSQSPPGSAGSAYELSLIHI